jgi:ABC-type lipopolysaccharide export system ATPase subunit
MRVVLNALYVIKANIRVLMDQHNAKTALQVRDVSYSSCNDDLLFKDHTQTVMEEQNASSVMWAAFASNYNCY